MEPAHEITGLLAEYRGGSKEALDRLIPLVFEDLRRLARHYLAHEQQGHTLQPTALVHEVYLRLVGQQLPRIEGRGQFFVLASRLIRQILVDHARAKRAAKRGAGLRGVELFAAAAAGRPRAVDAEVVLGLHQALDRLADLNPRQARLVELKYFCGLTLRQAARVLETSLATVERDWSFARRWLARELGSRSRRAP